MPMCVFSLCRYKGRPHWGKNFDRTFTAPNNPLRTRYPLFDQLLKQQAKYDPNKIYEPLLFTKMAKGATYALTPKCALNLECYCQQDIHCATGFQCVPSVSFPKYKICRAKGIPNSLRSTRISLESAGDAFATFTP